MKQFFIILFFSMAIQSYCQDDNSEFTLLFDSSDEGIGCYRIPAIVVASNGDLIVAVDERVPSCADLRGNKDVNIVLRRSQDNGKSWLEKERIIDFPHGISASDPSFILDQKSEKIFMFYNYMDLTEEMQKYRFHVVTSDDHGDSWSEPIDITDQLTEPNWQDDFMFITSGRGIWSSDGWLLHTMVNLERGAYVFGSKDGGQNWQRLGNPVKPGDESKIVALDGGKWMVNSRVNRAGVRHVHLSEDFGETWISSPDSSLIDPSCNAAIINIDKQLYFCNAENVGERRNLVLKKSSDSGLSWETLKNIYPAGAAYVTMDKMHTGELAIVFEKDNYKKVVFHKVKVK